MGTPTLWIGFNVCVLALLALDLEIFQRHSHVTSLGEAAAWSAFWIALSLGFNLWILLAHGSAPALEFFTGYLVEKSMSLDNLLVFVLVFRAFGVEARFQHRVLFWGVLGALVLRGALIGIGAALVARFNWILVGLGIFLVFAGSRMLLSKSTELNQESSRVIRWAKKILPVAHDGADGRFWVRENGRRTVTTLFLALIVLEMADLVFALDSVPAVFGITRDPFLVYTSNICAILGLRALYFLLAGTLPFFRYLNAGISTVLVFIGGKMIAGPWFDIPTKVSLAVVTAVLGTSIIASLLSPRASETDPA